MIKKIYFHKKKQLYFNGFTFSKIPIKFKDWKNNIELSKFIFNLFGGEFYIIKSDSYTHINDSVVKELLEYYEELRDHFIETGQLDIPIGYYPKYKLIKTCDLKKNDMLYLWYDILSVQDESSLNFMFSFSGGSNNVSIFSDDYDLDFLSSIWGEYANYCLMIGSDIKFYEYLSYKYTDYIGTKKFALIDTYSDDEDDENYLLISKTSIPNITKMEKIISNPYWYSILPKIITK